MAATIRDLKIALGMTVDQFFAAAGAAATEYEKLKKEVEEPLKPTIDKSATENIKQAGTTYDKTKKDIEKDPIDFNVRFQAGFRRAYDEYDKTKKRIERRPVRFRQTGLDDLIKKIGALGVAYLGLSQSVTFFREFETSIANVESLGVPNIEQLKNQIIEIGLDTPVPLNGLAAGLYNVVSAGVDAANQIDITRASAEAAKAGLAETTDSLNLGSAVIKGYGKDWSDFRGVMDQAFQTVKLGQTTFPELAASAGKVIPSFAALKIPVEQLFGAYATLTGVTGSAAEVSTQLASVARGLADPTAELTALIERQGFATVEQAVAQKGLSGILEIVKEATGGSATEMQKLFGRAEAVTALLSLTTSQFENFTEKSAAMANATGAASDAFEVQAKTLDSQLQILENRFNVVSSAILTGTVPAITTVVDAVASVLEWFARLDAGTQQAILSIGALTVALFKAPAAFSAVRAAIIALNASLGPVGWLILGIGAAATALAVYSDNSAEAAEANRKLEASNRALADSFNSVKNSAVEQFRSFSTNDLIEQQKLLNAELEIQKVRLGEINEVIASNNEAENIEAVLREKVRRQALNKEIVDEKNKERAKTIIQINEAKARLAALAKVLEDRKKQDAETAAEGIKNLDDFRKFQFDSGRINLATYVSYLEGRKAALRKELGEESIEYLRFADELLKLQSELAAQDLAGKPLSFRDQESTKRLIEVETGFSGDQSFEELQADYSARALLIESNLLLFEDAEARQTEAYRQELARRQELDRKYQEAKKALAIAGLRASLSLGAQLVNVFQGQSKTLFDIGKALSIANTTVNTIEAVSRAYKDYPWPANIAVAAIQAGLGLAQIQKVRSVNFSPPAGKKEGGIVTGADFLAAALPLPAGEDGYIAVRRREMVMNEGATAAFFPVFNQLNKLYASGRNPSGKIPSFAQGGRVDNVAGESDIRSSALQGAASDERFDEMLDAIRGIRIVINQDTDAVNWLRENYPKFEKLRNTRQL